MLCLGSGLLGGTYIYIYVVVQVHASISLQDSIYYLAANSTQRHMHYACMHGKEKLIKAGSKVHVRRDRDFALVCSDKDKSNDFICAGHALAKNYYGIYSGYYIRLIVSAMLINHDIVFLFDNKTASAGL